MNTLTRFVRDRLLPIKKNSFVFMSFGGHYSDSPKYISEQIHALNPQITIIWLVNKELLDDLPNYVMGIEIGTQEAHKALATAECIIDNVYGSRAYTAMSSGVISKLKELFFSWCYNKPKQKIYTTWHGTPLKRMGRDQIGNEVTDFICGNMEMILGNQFTLDKMKHLTFGKIEMKLLGTPRNDVLFCSNEKIREKLQLPKEKKIILFAPTFRNDGKDVEGKNVERSGINQLSEFDFEKLFSVLNWKFGGDWILICRFHYHVESMVDWKMLSDRYGGRIVNGNRFDDMAEYLAVTDILVTDASSCMFDFALTKRPCFIYFPDMEYYANSERGFYVSVNDLPFASAIDFNGLCDNISNFNQKQYQDNIDTLLEKFGYVDDAESSKRVAEYILCQHQK